jgi:hypothetical protein
VGVYHQQFNLFEHPNDKCELTYIIFFYVIMAVSMITVCQHLASCSMVDR